MEGDYLPYQVLAQVILRDFKLTKKIKTITGHTFSSLKTKTTKLPLLYSEPYLASFTLRNKRLSHSSSRQTYSEFDLLEIKIKEKTKMRR